jgi:hypothetical protein
MLRLDSKLLPGFKETLQALVLETLDHAPKCNPLRYASQGWPHITPSRYPKWCYELPYSTLAIFHMKQPRIHRGLTR